MKSFIIKWPALGLQVSCEPAGVNTEVFELFCENLPQTVLQGHEVVGGWMLRDRAVRFCSKPYAVEQAAAVPLCGEPDGTLFLVSPQGTSGELVIKYGDCADNRPYIPFAKVAEADMAALRKAGRAAWKSAARTKDVIVSVIEGGE